MERLFGTDGIRGVVNELMKADFALEIGLSVGTYLHGKGSVGIATDTRTSNIVLKNALLSGLLSAGIDVIDFGIVPTPALQYGVKTRSLSLGVVITASHNPPEFNGIKCIASDGTELARNDEEKIEQIYFSKNYLRTSWNKLGNVSEYKIIPDYLASVSALVNVNAIRNKRLKVVLDCANGAGCYTAPYLLEELGCEVVTLNAQPLGVPSHPSEPTEENLQELIKTMKSANADIGIAHDGDADRVVFVSEKGSYIPGEKMLALCAREAVRENKGGLVVTAVSSSSCLEDVVVSEGGKVEYTKVGSPIIARVMREKKAVFGGEENGGLIFPKFQYCRDGAMGAAKVLELLAKTNLKPSELIDEIPKYFLYKTKIPCQEEKKEKALSEYTKTKKKENLKILSIDGVKIFFAEGWVLVRPSGTEPIYRIFAEAKSFEKARALAERERELIEKIIKSE